MKTTALIGLGLVLAGMLAVPRLAAQTNSFWYPYDMSATGINVPNPTGTNTINCILPEGDGSYVVVWDTPDSGIMERRDAAGNLLWRWSPPTPLPVPSELTRVVLAGRQHTLWCGTARWFYLENTNGLPVRSGLWSLPYLDPGRIIIQNDNLHVLYGTSASVYNTNMEFQTVLTNVTLPEGYWQSYNGTWLVDFSGRQDYAVRAALLGAGLQVGTPFRVPLPADTAGGYVDHRVLGATDTLLMVASTIHWPTLVQSRVYYTMFDRNGTVRAQHLVICNQIITGSAVLPDGRWVLSAQFLGETTQRQSLLIVDQQGRPYWQVLVQDTAPVNYSILNVNPPRAMRLASLTALSLHATTPRPWYEVWGRLVLPPSYWVDDGTVFPAPSTNHFWNTPVLPNNT